MSEIIWTKIEKGKLPEKEVLAADKYKNLIIDHIFETASNG